MPKKSATGKTKIWDVVTSEDDWTIGTVKWDGRWRRYAFLVYSETIFEEECLREIASFCQDQTKKQRQQWQKKRVSTERAPK